MVASIGFAEKFAPLRAGVASTVFVFSYSGAMLVDGPLEPFSFHLDNELVDVAAPLRIGAPSLRPTPQITQHNLGLFLQFGGDVPFPVQCAAFAARPIGDGASVSVWFGPDLDHGAAPALPDDTLAITVHGPDSTGSAERLERNILKPFLEWLRVLTDQWWIGRSFEQVSGALHFAIPLDAARKGVRAFSLAVIQSGRQ